MYDWVYGDVEWVADTFKKSHQSNRYLSDIELDVNRIVGNGVCSGPVDEPAHIAVGVHEIAIEKKRFLFGFKSMDVEQPVSDSEMIRFLVALQHEYQHVMQRCTIYQNPTEENIKLSISDLSTYGNKKYYDKNYDTNWAELDAEQAGIANTFKMLQDSLYFGLPESEAEQLIMEYVHFRQDTGSYFIDGQYNSVMDVVDAFEQKKQMYFQTRRNYTIVQYGNTDDISMLMCDTSNGRWMLRREWEPIFDKLYDVDNIQCSQIGFEQDKMIACLEVYCHPERKSEYRALDNVDLSPETVFGFSLPEISSNVKVSTQKSSQTINRRNMGIMELESRLGLSDEKGDFEPDDFDFS